MDRSLNQRLLSLVRKAWSDPTITAEYDPEDGWRIDAQVAAVRDFHGYQYKHEALITALELAPSETGIERAAVVAWLRACEDESCVFADDIASQFAAEIERGEHRLEGEE